MIAWAMECTEKGILTKADTDGLDLRWGNYKAAHEMISMIAKREGFGNILANGPIPAVKHVGNGSEKFMVQIKGMTIPMHDHRAVWGHGLSYAVGSVGHEGGPIGLELFGGVPRFSIEKKAQLVKDGQSSSWSLANILGVCAFGTYGISPGLMADTLSAVVGLEFSVDALTKVAMRGVNLRHAFGIRNGLTPADDTLPYRYTDDPTMDGGAKGSKIPIKQLVSDYYNVMGWDPITGKPYRKTLIELGLNKEANDLWGDGNLC